MQEKVVMYQMLQGQLEQFNQQAALLERKHMELEATKEIITDMSKMKEGKEMLLPLGGEMFTYGKITNPKDILVNIGAGVVVGNNIKVGTELIDKKLAEIVKLREHLQKDSTAIAKKMAEIEAEVRKEQQK